VLIACGGAQHVEEPRCPIERRLVLASPEEVRGAAGCRTASAVIVRTGATLDFAQLGRLESIEGDLVIGPTVGVDEVQFVALRSVGGTIHVSSNGAVRGVYLPKLERAGRIEIEGNVALTTVSLPRLAAVAGGVSVTDNAVLELFDAGALVTIGKELVVDGAPSLTLLELGKLVKDAGIRIERAPLLPPEVVEQLGKPPASP
jgi:hypothetical protein